MNRQLILIFYAVITLAFLPALGFAQGAHHPFAVGATEGAVGAANVTGIGGWILAQESGFFRMLSGALRAAKESGAAAFGLIALSLGYGIFHAAGPGHGKAVIASYMLANEQALRRGLLIALGAAFLQGASAVLIVGLGAFVFQTAAARMTQAAQVIELVSYTGIAVLGIYLVYVKGRALMAAGAKPYFAPHREVAGTATHGHRHEGCTRALDHDTCCGHAHIPQPDALIAHFSWKTALLTIVAAGARPCSGAILVLVFALAQGIFKAGILAVVAISLGTAITTSVLAGAAVYAKTAVVKYSKASSHGAVLAGRVFEFGAALVVFGLGLTLLLAVVAGTGAAA
ncbi:MAG TPA: nickel/cobalt transporter [Methylocella sp.]|nr:nickel/cobalt transporter [Methylocella sp.]